MSYNNNLSICIVTYNSASKVGNTVKTIKQFTNGINYQLFVSDNGSTDNTEDVVKSADPNVIFIENNDNIGFGKANNKVLPLINSKYHAIVNPDITLSSDILTELCNYLDTHSDVSMVTPKIVFPDGREQNLPKRIPKFKYLLSRRLPFMKKLSTEYTRSDEVFTAPEEIDFCTGCFAVIRTDVFKSVGGFDERFFMYFEDADLTLKAKEYGKTIFHPHITAIHAWERSSAKSLKYFLIHVSSMFKFLKKYRKRSK